MDSIAFFAIGTELSQQGVFSPPFKSPLAPLEGWGADTTLNLKLSLAGSLNLLGST